MSWKTPPNYIPNKYPTERGGQVAEDVETPDFIIPTGYILMGWLDFGGNVWPARKFGCYPYFKKIPPNQQAVL